MEQDSIDVQVGAVSKGKELLLMDIQEDTDDDELMLEEEEEDDLIDDDEEEYDYLYADESEILQSQFDKMDNIPTGVEASFPLFTNLTDQIPAPQQSDEKIPINSSTLLGSVDKSASFPIPPHLQSSLWSTSEPAFSGSTEEVQGKLLESIELFKKFDTADDCSDHFYFKNDHYKEQPPKKWAKRVQEEWRILEKDLPDKQIFVRVYESRMDLLRAAIVGAEGTPYHNGLFFFDVFFPSNYPDQPPHVHYHSRGLRINPNLYKCGKVCLSLLGTWSGIGQENWVPGVSTMLQVLVSIQALILNADPYFNEPGYETTKGSSNGERMCFDYNMKIFIYSLRTMMFSVRMPPKHFEDLVVTHFCYRGKEILKVCEACLEGWKVGWLGEGKDSGYSIDFKKKLSMFVSLLLNLFTTLGAKDLHEFHCLAEKGR